MARSSAKRPVGLVLSDNEMCESDGTAVPRSMVFSARVEAAAKACNDGEFEKALRLYNDVVRIDPTNNVLYSNRSAILCKLGRFADALDDAHQAQTLKPGWAKAYFRKGYALKCMGDHVRAMVTYATGLAQDATNEQLLGALVECANLSMLKDSFAAVYEELVNLRLENSAFVVVSVVGQELLSAGFTQEAVQVLESAVRIDTTSLKLKQSVLSSLSSAYWKLNDRKRAADFMLQDLAVAASLGDTKGESRAHANLGMLRLAEDDVIAALDHYRHQLLLELKMDNQRTAAAVLSIVGQLYLRVGDYENALASYQQCLEMMPGLPDEDRADPLEIAAQVEGMGDVYFAKNDYDAALDCYRRCLEVARANKKPSDQAKASCAIGRTLIKQGHDEEGMKRLRDALALARDAKDKAMEATVCGQMSTACQTRDLWAQAKRWAEKQLQIGLRLKDAALEGEACGHLGMFYQQAGDSHSALRLHEKHLQLAQSINDNGSVMQAKRNLGLCCLASGNIDGALHYHKGEMELARRAGDRSAESAAHGNLARVYARLSNSAQQLTHLQCQWQLVKDSINLKAQAKALTALGEFYNDSGDHAKAVMFLEKSLMLAQEQADMDAERNNCARLGLAHLALSQPREATRYFEQELAIAKDQRNHAAMALAYKHLGDAQLKLGHSDEALDCQKYFLALAHISSDVSAKLDAMEKIGGILLQRRDIVSAVKVFSKGLKLAVTCKNRRAEAQLYGQLGHCHTALERPEKAMAFYSEELATYSTLNDVRGKFDAFGHIAEHYCRERRSDLALRMCANRIEVGRCAGDVLLEAEGYAETGNTCQLFSLFDDALKSYEEALRLLGEKCTTNTQTLRMSVLVNVAECSERLGRIADAVCACEKYLSLSVKPAEVSEQIHRKLGSLFLIIGRFGDSVSHFDASIELITSASFPCSPDVVIESYRGLAAARVADGDLVEAMEALEARLQFVRQMGLNSGEGQALSDLGFVYRLQGHDQMAMQMMEKDVELSERIGDAVGVVRALHRVCQILECRMDLAQLASVVARLGQIADRSTGPVSVDVNLCARMASGGLYMLSEQWLAAVTELDKAAGLAVSAQRPDIEAEIRLAQAAVALVLGRKEVCASEMDRFVRMNVTHPPMREAVGNILRTGKLCRLAKLACLLQMISCDSDPLRALVSAERCAFFEAYEIAARKMLPLKSHKDRLPSAAIVSTALSALRENNETLIYQFSFNSFQITWIALPTGEIEHYLTATNELCCDYLDGSWTAVKATILNAISKYHPIRSVEDVDAKIASLKEHRVVNVGFAKLGGHRRLCNLSQLRLHYGGVSKMNEAQIPTLVVCTTITDSSAQIGRTLATKPIMASDLSADVLLAKISLSRLVHLEVDLDVQGFRLNNSESSESDSLCDQNDTAHEVVDIEFDAIATTPMLTELLVVVGCADERKMTAAANAFLLAGVKSLVFVDSKHDCASFCSDLYCELKKGVNILDAINTVARAEVTAHLYGANSVCNQHERSLSVALRALIHTPDECREALRVILHLVEKSLQRIHSGQESVMYTSENSVRSKVGPEAAGWRETLEALGFTRSVEEGDVSIHFPRSEHTAVLSLGSSVFQALLGLPQTTLVALSQLSGAELYVEPIIDLISTLDGLAQQLTTTRLPHFEATLAASLYNHPGISRLFASLGFDKLLENAQQVFVKTIRVELTNKKCNLAVTAMKTMFSDLLIGYHVTDPTDSRTDSSPIQSLTHRLGHLDVADWSTETIGRSQGLSSSVLASGKQRRRGRKGVHANGYSSEGELKAGRGKRGGYFSDDERKRGLRDDDDEGMMSGGELLETTARVLSIDERASPISDDDIRPPLAQKLPDWLTPRTSVTVPAFLQRNEFASLVVRDEPSTERARPPPPSYDSVRRRQEELNSSAFETGDESDAETLRCVASKYVRCAQLKGNSLQRQYALHMQNGVSTPNPMNVRYAPSLNASMI